jgi:serine/threonine protein kinase
MSAVDLLQGLTLPNGWLVREIIARHPNGTGGTFSLSYRVERGSEVGFLKAFDFAVAFDPGVNTPQMLQILGSAYDYEREILEHCRQRKLSHVVQAIDHGQVQVPGLSQMEGRVYYLIFEMAAGDVRCQIDRNTRFDAAWCLQALKDASLGLWQVHRQLIAHQDMKPSNVLHFGDRGFKIADFGRSSRRGQNVWYDNHNIAGDKSYAPPEQIYGHIHSDFIPRRMGCDLYMLGNLASFLFSGVNVTSQLFARLDPQFHPTSWNSDYADVLPYLQHAFSSVLSDLGPSIDSDIRPEIVGFIKELCNPDLYRRGHPKGVSRNDQYSLERYVAHLDMWSKKLAVTRRIKVSA